MTTPIGFDIFAKDRASGTFRGVGSAIGKADEKAGALKSTLKGLAAGFVGLEVIQKGTEFLKGSIAAATDDQAAQRKLALALKNTTGANKEQVSSVEEMLTKQSLATGISKDELMPAYQKLAESTGSLTKAHRELKIAEDVSAGTGKDLSVVAAAMMKANNGTTSSLSRLGLKTKETKVDTLGLEKAHLAVTQAQEGVTAAVKKYGANSGQANAATVKLHAAQANLHTVMTKGKTITLTMDQALRKMADTYGGQAAAKAHSFDGTMQRLHTTFHEAEVEVGTALLPKLQQLADWFLNKGLPAAKGFFHEYEQGEGTAGRIHTVLSALFGTLKSGAGFLNSHRAILVGVVAAWAAWKTVVMANNTVQAISLIRLKAQTIGTVENRVVTLASAAASKAWAAAQWLLNAAMDANPIGLVVVAVAALAAGFIFAMKHSQAFRSAVTGAFNDVKKVVTGSVSAVVGFVKSHWQLLVSILGGPIGAAAVLIVSHFGQIKAAVTNSVGDVIGFVRSIPGRITGALGDLGHLLWNAGTQVIQGLISGIESKVSGLTSVLHKVTSLIPLHKGPIEKDRALLQPAGVAIMDGLIHGITSRQVPLQRVLSAVTAQVQAANQKLKTDLQARNQFAGGFQSFATSAFGADFGTDAAGNPVSPTAGSIIAYQQAQAAQAKTVRDDVRKLVGMGLSPALLKQLQSQGASGFAEIQALAAGSQDQIAAYNAADKATSGYLGQAGMSAGNAIYGSQIAADRKRLEQDRKLDARLHELAGAIHDLTHATWEMEGDHLILRIRKTQTRKGQKPTV